MLRRRAEKGIKAVCGSVLLLACGCGGRHSAHQTNLADTPQTTLVALNDAGQMAGGARDMVNLLPAFVQSGEVKTPLAVPPGFSWVFPHSLNARGTAAGFAERSVDQTRHAVVWERGVARLLDDRGARSSEAAVINERGDIAGFAHSPDSALHTLLWRGQTPNAPATEITPLSRAGCHPTGINNQGDIAGWRLDAQNRSRLFLWRNQRLIDLGGGVHAAVNNAGDVAGDTDTPDGLRACRWRQGSPVLLPLPFAASQSSALALNDRGQVVGRAAPQDRESAPHAVLWQNNHALDLNTILPPDSPYTLEEAAAINNAGQILCTARQGIWERSALLTPSGSRWNVRLF